MKRSTAVPNPPIIDEFLMLEAKKKQFDATTGARLNKIRPAVIKILQHTTIPGISFSETEKLDVNAEKAMRLAHKHLPQELFETLFTSVFDPNLFLKLMRKKKYRRMRRYCKSMGIIFKKPSQRITVVRPRKKKSKESK